MPARTWRYLPLVLLTTASVVALPVAIVAAIVPRGGIPSIAISALATVAVSVAIANLEAVLWARISRSQDLTFAELMLWGWARRCWAERAVAQQRELYDCARKIGPEVSIDQLERLSRMLEARDSCTHGHSRRVARHAARIARKMRLPEKEVAKIRTAAAVHDVGKIYTPKEILSNPGRLTDAEFEVIKRHPADGAGMLAIVGDPEIAAMVRHHHERIDGCGYPDGISGEEIPLGARIIAVADTFDALTSNRPYRDANTHRRALRILSGEAGTQLDAAAVAAFLSRYSSRGSIVSISFAAAMPQRILTALQSASTSLGVSASGATSILPALGASGLLALSSAPGHKAKTNGGLARRGHDTAVEDLAERSPAILIQHTPFRSRHESAGIPNSSLRRHSRNRHMSAGSSGSGLPLTPSSTASDVEGTTTGNGGSYSAQTSAAGSQQASSGSSSNSSTEATAPPGPSPSVSNVAAGATETLTKVTAETLAGTTTTVSSTAEAVSGPEGLSAAAGSLLSGTKSILEGVEGSL